MTPEAPGRGIKFRESMPKPLLVAFLGTAVAAVGLVAWLLASPPVPKNLALGSRRSPPSGTFTHNVVRAIPVDIPTPIPAFDPPCDAGRGIVIEGGEAAQGRIGSVLRQFLCRLDRDETQPPEVKQAIRALADAKVRFAVLTRTGEQSTADLTAKRIMINVDLARTSVDPTLIAPLLVHEGWHLSTGGPVTAAQEFGARVAELQACRVVYRDDDEPSRGCVDAQAIVKLGETRAIELLVRAGFPR
jgi:hypothetical protein